MNAFFQVAWATVLVLAIYILIEVARHDWRHK